MRGVAVEAYLEVDQSILSAPEDIDTVRKKSSLEYYRQLVITFKVITLLLRASYLKK